MTEFPQGNAENVILYQITLDHDSLGIGVLVMIHVFGRRGWGWGWW